SRHRRWRADVDHRGGNPRQTAVDGAAGRNLRPPDTGGSIQQSIRAARLTVWVVGDVQSFVGRLGRSIAPAAASTWIPVSIWADQASATDWTSEVSQSRPP